MLSENAFALGLFGVNCGSGLAVTNAPERWDASWRNNTAAARLAEEAGFEFMLPIARWHGYKGRANAQGASFETMTWAAGLLGATREITVFATLHTPFLHPIFAAKQAVTIQSIGGGRFGLNIVAGGNEPEFQMFGVDLLEHDDRYLYAEEWIDIAKKVWAEDAPFDYAGRFFKLQGVMLEPKPVDGHRPLIISAGSSGAGRSFAARHADSLFMNIVSLDTLPAELEALRHTGNRASVRVFASGHVMCRRTTKEAKDFHHYIVHEQGDWDAVENILNIRKHQKSIPMEKLVTMKERLIGGIGTWPIVGDPDTVAETFGRIHAAGIDGMAIGLIDYIKDLPLIRDEVLPRLERLGLRRPSRHLSSSRAEVQA